jgi:hypothetical protein
MEAAAFALVLKNKIRHAGLKATQIPHATFLRV